MDSSNPVKTVSNCVGLGFFARITILVGAFLFIVAALTPRQLRCCADHASGAQGVSRVPICICVTRMFFLYATQVDGYAQPYGGSEMPPAPSYAVGGPGVPVAAYASPAQPHYIHGALLSVF